MGRTALVTVPDEGAAWTVRDALAAGGVTCEVERVGREHPYISGALAQQMRIFVDEAQLGEAKRLLAGLEAELATDQDELAAEALSAGRLAEESAAAEAAAKAATLPPPRKLKLVYGLVLALLPLPCVCFYAGVRWLGLLFLVLFFVGFGQDIPGLEALNPLSDMEGWPFGSLLPVAKLADAVVGIVVLVLRRPRD